MASHFGILRSYFKLVNRAQVGDYPSKKNLLDLFEESPISARTLERYLFELNEEFGINIKYNRSRKGYELVAEDDIGVEQFFKFMEFSGKANLMQDILNTGKEGLKYLDFEEKGLLKGVHFLSPLFHATRKQQVCALSYYKFDSEEVHEHVLYPYLLKEYQGRWYIIGYCEDQKDTRTFAVDRIRELVVRKDKFRKKPLFKKLENLDHCIGLNWSNEKIERIVIRFTEYQAKYQRALPWHWSQKELETEPTTPKGFVDFEFRLIINYELKQKIWMLGKEVEVLEPEGLK